MCVLGVERSEKKCGPPPQDNFWNSPYGQQLGRGHLFMHRHYKMPRTGTARRFSTGITRCVSTDTTGCLRIGTTRYLSACLHHPFYTGFTQSFDPPLPCMSVFMRLFNYSILLGPTFRCPHTRLTQASGHWFKLLEHMTKRCGCLERYPTYVYIHCGPKVNFFGSE